MAGKENKSGLGGIFDGIEKLLELAAELQEKQKQTGSTAHSTAEEVDLSHIKDGLKGVFGFSIRTAVGGETSFEPFGNIRKTPQGPKVAQEREPITDVFDEGNELLVIAEMPGVSAADIQLAWRGDTLDIAANTPNRNYRKLLSLEQYKPDAASLKQEFKDGLLKIRLTKKNN